MKRVIVFIDGNNFYFGLRKIYGKNRSLKHFDFEGFAKFLADNNKIVGIYYYNALLDKKHNLEKYKSQKEFFENLKKIPSFNLVLCKLLKRNIPGTNKVYYIIKEDDINMAVDIVENACDDNFDTKKIVFSQTPYFSSRARKTIFRVIKNPTRPGIYSRVLDIDRKAVEHVKLMGFNSVKSNLFEKIKGKFDIIAFNAQYLPSDQHDKEKDTTGGKRGDEIILRFLKQVRKHLENKGKIFLLLSSLTPRKRIEKELENQRLSIANIFKKRIFFEKLEVWVIGES